jgi:phage gp36-like protein
MALPEFSTLQSVQTRANSKRIKGWTDKDKDSIPDPDTLTAGFQYASGLIFEYLVQRYGETQLAAWTSADCPARLLAISDDLCLHYFSSANYAQNDLIIEIYRGAIQSLENIRDYKVGLYGATESMTDKYVFEETDSQFEELTYWNEV